MGSRGPKSKKDLERAGDIAEGAPVKPADLPPEAEILWDHVIEWAPWVRAIDQPLMEEMCRAWVLARKAYEWALEDPLEVSFGKRYVEYIRVFESMASRLGLTPADRAKIKYDGESRANTGVAKLLKLRSDAS